jgi:two-component system NtrC family response regulator
LAHGGTLFLDEIGELSANLQVKLLRVLQEKAFERVGGVRSIAVDIRVIAATNKNLYLEMRTGRFREDLFYRLNVVHIVIPPLRDRREDIHLLVNHFIQKYAAERKSAVPVRGVTQEVDRLFDEYSWPGNVRELENVIERVMILCPNEIITDNDLPRGFRSSLDNALHLDGIPAGAKLYETLEMVERAMILRALKMADNVQSHAAAILGIGKSGLNQKIKRYSLELGAKS